MTDHDIRVTRRKFSEFAHGIRRADVVSSGIKTDDRIRYYEFDYLAGNYTGRSLWYCVRLADPLDCSRVVVSLDPISDRGEGPKELCCKYNEARMLMTVPHSLVYVLEMSKSEAGAYTLAGLIQIADSAFHRLYPWGPVPAFYRLINGPHHDAEVNERELRSINENVVGLGQYRLSGSTATWRDG